MTFYARCIAIKLPAAGSPLEVHKLIPRYDTPTTYTVPGNSTRDRALQLQVLLQGDRAGFDAVINTQTVANMKGFFWFLGMNPQIKSRDYRFPP